MKGSKFQNQKGYDLDLWGNLYPFDKYIKKTAEMAV